MKTLLLDKEYRPISFITFRKVLKHVYKENAEILSVWKGSSFYGNLEYPAVLILKNYARRKQLKAKFTFTGVLRRDLYTCQYSGVTLPPSKLNVDHIIPKSRGGHSNWENCVAASKEINARKGYRTLEESGLMLIRKPEAPKDVIALEFALLDVIHEDWPQYFPSVKRIGKFFG